MDVSDVSHKSTCSWAAAAYSGRRHVNLATCTPMGIGSGAGGEWLFNCSLLSSSMSVVYWLALTPTAIVATFGSVEVVALPRQGFPHMLKRVAVQVKE